MVTYKIVCKHFDMNHPDHNKLIASGLTLEEAQSHCSDESTHEKGVWMDVFYEEGRLPKPPSKLDKLCMLLTKNPETYFGC
jgi:hypothetical protein